MNYIKFSKAFVFSLLLVFAVVFNPLCAQKSYAKTVTVSKINIEGAQRVEPETVRSYIMVKEGDLLSSATLDLSLKSLFATGLFADVKIAVDKGTVTFKVVENPIVNRVAFEGNKRIKAKQLQDEMQLNARSVYTRAKVRSDVQRIIDVYKRSGRFAVTVEPKLIERPQNRVDIVFEINEGPTTYVRRINFIGNTQYSDSKLREEIVTKEERWYRFFSAADTYDPDRLIYDKELLRRFYQRKGYADFKVKSAVAELIPDRSGFYITVTVDEGERYKFGGIDVKTTLPNLDVDEVKAGLEMQLGDWYSAKVVDDTVHLLTDKVGDLGYAFVDVSPTVDKNTKEKKISLAFNINEGPRTFVEQIDIHGNIRTMDKVIRREMRLVEGDAFNAAKLKRSKQRIADLGYFERIEVEALSSDVAADKTIIDIGVEEKSTGELSFGVGWSTDNGPLLQVGLAERNLLGKGQMLNASVSAGGSKSEFDISYTEPYFMDRDLSVGWDAFYLTSDYQDESSYDKRSAGGAVRVGWDYTENLRHSVKYTLRKDNISNIASDASRFIKEQAGTSTLSMVSHNLFYDKRDSARLPTEGYFLGFGNRVAGLGGDQKFVAASFDYGKYFPLEDQWVLRVKGGADYITAIDDEDVNINYRFFLGGSSLRGFEPAGVGARDIASGDALGGNWRATTSAQLSFPLGLPNELGIKGKVFADAGMLGEPDNLVSAEVDYSSEPRVSIGAGLVWGSPVGPINVDVAIPVMKEDYDRTESLRLSFDTNF
ncbi:MAG: outer membrane protein assembly factor BamA [Alphaproteobacteria bacterium]|nr:outer membrane protein assembly factor BamA [Alphaproteobacteria bacterium]